jgi:uncharacterized membrane protein
MASKLVALAFEGQFTAEGMLDNLRALEQRGALQIEDAVMISRAAVGERLIMHPAGSMGGPAAAVPGSSTEVTQTTFSRGKAAAKGAGLGALVGWVLGGPIGGAAVGALIGGLRDRGIDDKFVNAIAERIHSDSSALLLLVQAVDGAAVLEEIRPFKGVVLQTELSPEAENSLRDALAREE